MQQRATKIIEINNECLFIMKFRNFSLAIKINRNGGKCNYKFYFLN